MASVIKVEHLSKKYRIGQVQSGQKTFREALSDMATAPFRRLKSFGQSSHREEDSIWALKDISFEVEHGEVLGIIGRNGAGKSTLLKILSEITRPTEGLVEIHGRVSSLLEVGTGFHPELTGRENVFLNGAILGMTREEIKSKFDEIVEFAETIKFIDTPVKRYSSGMQVRLAFAVAAHLEPEILLIDEVLAVGDTSFQKKCLGKMNDIARSGRTILFVSHNLAAVESLCSKSVLLDQGQLIDMGDTVDILDQYLGSASTACGDVDLTDNPGRTSFPQPILQRMLILNTAGDPVPYIPLGEDVTFEVRGRTEKIITNATLGIRISKPNGQRATTCLTSYQYSESITLNGNFMLSCFFKNCRLMPGCYSITLVLKSDQGTIDEVDDLAFEVTPRDIYKTGKVLPERTGIYIPEVRWNVKQ